MSRYVQLNIEEIREAFTKKDPRHQGWKEIVSGNEIVFEWAFMPGCVIRVLSSCSAHRDAVRSKGTDCIRVNAVDFRKGTGDKALGLVKSQRVLRVEGWRENLRKAIVNVYKLAYARANKPSYSPGLFYPRDTHSAVR